MNLNKVLVSDIEGNGFLDVIDRLWVFGCAYQTKGGWKIKTTTKKEDIKKMLEDPEVTLVGHNFFSFDIPALQKLYPDVIIRCSVIDTLTLSYYLYSELDKHGLAAWGERFGVPKVEVKDGEWLGIGEVKEKYIIDYEFDIVPVLSKAKYLRYKKEKEDHQALMTHRVIEDCKINTNLWVKMLAFLRELYDNDDVAIVKVIEYFNHKAGSLAMQDQNPILIDLKLSAKNLKFLEDIVEEKTLELAAIMPDVEVKSKKKFPAKPYKKDGSLSTTGLSWFKLLKEQGLPEDHTDDVTYVSGHKPPNGSADGQIKSLLFSLGWKPTMFKKGANGLVPQIRDDDKDLCPDIYRLIKENPELEALDGLSVAKHRAGYLKSFLEKSNDEGYAKAWAHGFARTTRLKHVAPFVNLPKPNAKHGELVRACMIAPPGYVMIGADLSSIEDKCKQISIFDLDPTYVESMNTKGWDAHLALGVIANMITPDEAEFYKWYKAKPKLKEGEENPYTLPEAFQNLSEEELDEAYEIIDKKRATAKTTNYAATYGAGAKAISVSAGISLREAKKLHNSYWVLNWAVKSFAKSRIVKTVKGSNYIRLHKKAGGLKEVKQTNWVWNEYTGLWLFLKNDKDRFSACNQSFGVKIFDTWGYFMRKAGIKQIFESHDEYLWYCKEENVERDIKIIKDSIVKVNKVFNPPVPIECDYKVGSNYSEVH